MAAMAAQPAAPVTAVEGGDGSHAATPKPTKLHGRAFYESLGSPKYIVAPMVDQSEFAWRMLSRSFLPPAERASILAYSPMLHARLFADTQKYRDQHFKPTRPKPRQDPSSETVAGEQETEPYLDGNPALDRPLIVQFCANDPETLLAAAERVAPHCDAVDLNLGCPQGIARKGRYGAFLQEDQDLIYRMIRILHERLPVPVTAKIRILDTREATLAYAKNVLKAGASFLTVHGRRREQKGHLTGLADWAVIRYLRDNLPPDTVLFANGNVLQPGDLARCLAATGADAVMSAEGNLSDPGLFAAPPPPGSEGREFWRGRSGRGGWRVDAVVRRYLDILHRYVLGVEPPARRPLFLPGDDAAWLTATATEGTADGDAAEGEPPRKKRKHDGKKGGAATQPQQAHGANFSAMQPHLFHLLRHFVSKHTDVRDMLARAPRGGLEAYEAVLSMVERKVAEGLLEYERVEGKGFDDDENVADTAGGEPSVFNGAAGEDGGEGMVVDDPDCSAGAIRRCRRPWWVAQPIVRPLPKEAMAKGAVSVSKKEKERLAREKAAAEEVDKAAEVKNGETARAGGEGAQGAVEALEKSTSFQRSELVSG